MSEYKEKYHMTASVLIAFVSGLVLFFFIAFYPVIRGLVASWINSDDHSYGMLILPVCLYILWKKRLALKTAEMKPGPAGKSLIATAILFYIVSYKAGISTISSISMVMTIWAIAWTLLGKTIFKLIFFPLALLLLMIPVPAQFFSMATIPLQLTVSKVSTGIIRLLDIPVLREGNVIQLPGRTLEVVEACSGLRSLMSLITLCTIFGYLILSSNILRGLLIAASIPVAVLVNILRVILLVFVQYYLDLDLTRGTSHTIFGIIVFILAVFIVVALGGVFLKWNKNLVGN